MVLYQDKDDPAGGGRRVRGLPGQRPSARVRGRGAGGAGQGRGGGRGQGRGPGRPPTPPTTVAAEAACRNGSTAPEGRTRRDTVRRAVPPPRVADSSPSPSRSSASVPAPAQATRPGSSRPPAPRTRRSRASSSIRTARRPRACPSTVVGYDDAGFAGLHRRRVHPRVRLHPRSSRSARAPRPAGGAADDRARRRATRDSLPGSYVAGTETDTDWVVTAALPAAAGQVRRARGRRSSSRSTSPSRRRRPCPSGSRPRRSRWTDGRRRLSVDGDPAAGHRPGRARSPSGGTSSVQPAPRATVDLRRLESTGERLRNRPWATVTAYADVRVPHANGRTIYHQAGVDGRRWPLPDVDLVPPSRGARRAR